MTDVPVYDFRKPGKQSDVGEWALSRSVFLVGFMGAGKTSVARKVARRGGLASIDMDAYIERRCDMKIARLFDEYGEEGFRAIEADTLRDLVQGEPCLISCGGGVVLAQENRQLLKKAYVVYLQVTAEEAASRISNLASRPLFGNLAHARDVMADRQTLYEEVADAVVDTAGRGTGAIAWEVFRLLKDKGVLWQKG